MRGSKVCWSKTVWEGLGPITALPRPYFSSHTACVSSEKGSCLSQCVDSDVPQIKYGTDVPGF